MKPISIRSGNAAVKIYENKFSGKSYYTLSYYVGTKRVRESRPTLEAAKDAARIKASELDSTGQTTSSGARAAMEIAALRMALGRHSIQTAVSEWLDARKQLGDVPVGDAVRYYVERHRVSTCSPSEIIPKFIADLKADGAGIRHVSNVESRCKLFASAFQKPMNDIAAMDIDGWLRQLQSDRKLTGRSRNHYRAAISVFCSWAKRSGHLARTWNEVESVAKAAEEDGDVEIYTPDQARKLIEASDSARLPYFVLSLFCGIRRSEIFRLKWEDVDLVDKQVFVVRGKVRTAGHRIVPIPDNAVEMLGRFSGRIGTIFKSGDTDHFLNPVAFKAGVEWKQNAPRRSYISYRLAITQNSDQVSSETGTSTDTITKRYRRPVPLKAAKEWFSICPKI